MCLGTSRDIFKGMCQMRRRIHVSYEEEEDTCVLGLRATSLKVSIYVHMFVYAYCMHVYVCSYVCVHVVI